MKFYLEFANWVFYAALQGGRVCEEAPIQDSSQFQLCYEFCILNFLRKFNLCRIQRHIEDYRLVETLETYNLHVDACMIVHALNFTFSMCLFLFPHSIEFKVKIFVNVLFRYSYKSVEELEKDNSYYFSMKSG